MSQPLTPPGLTLEVKRLRSALVALAILYGGYAAVLALAPSSRGTPPLAYLAAATALNCGLFGFFLHWSSSETSWTRWLGFLTASLSVLNPLAHLFLVRDPIQTTHLIFILLGASFALSSTLRFILVWTISLSAWFVIATPSLQFTEWRFYSYALAAGAFGSLAIQIARAAAHRRALATPAAELFDGEKFGAGSDRLQLAVRGTDDGLWCWDLATDELHLSPRWKSMLGYDAGDVDDKLDEWFSRVHPYYHPALKGALADHIRGDTDQFELQYRIRHRDGTYRWVLSRGTAERDSEGKVLRIGGSQTDITALIEVEKHLIHDALHDTLTGLPNRGFLMRQLETITDRQCLFAVLFMDLDRFKSINDSLGHEVGDQLLMETAKRLNSCARSGDTVARLGGDEFVIVLSGLRKPEDAEQLARRIQEAMQAPLELAGNELSLSASIGIAIADGRSSTDQLLRNADIAMYEAKTDAGKIRVFSPDMQGRRVHSRQLQDDLRQAKRKAG